MGFEVWFIPDVLHIGLTADLLIDEPTNLLDASSLSFFRKGMAETSGVLLEQMQENSVCFSVSIQGLLTCCSIVGSTSKRREEMSELEEAMAAMIA